MQVTAVAIDEFTDVFLYHISGNPGKCSGYSE